MIMQIFSIYDSAPKVFSQPFYQSNKATAIRSFADAVNEGTPEKNVYKRHPEYYTLFYLGEYDDQKAAFNNERVPVKVITALECLKDQSMSDQMKVTNTPVGLVPGDMYEPENPAVSFVKRVFNK